MKKIMLLLMIIVLSFSSFNLSALAANDDYDIEEMAKYDGFGKAFYESLVETQTYISGKHTNNTQYVKDSIDQTINYAGDYFDRWSELADNEKYTKGEILKNVLSEVAGGIATIPDVLLSTLGFWKERDEQETEIIPSSFFYTCVVESCITATLNQNYKLVLSEPVGQYNRTSLDSGSQFNTYMTDTSVYIKYSSWELVRKGFKTIEDRRAYLQKYNHGAVHLAIHMLKENGINVILTYNDEEQPINELRPNTTINNIRNFIDSGDSAQKIPDDYVPKLTSKLVCPSETYQLMIQGSEFKLLDGTVVDVAYDGTATLNGEECHLEWVKPKIELDENDNVIFKDTEKDKEENNSDCDSILCFLSSILKSIADLAETIVSGIIDGLETVFKFLFVPSSDFWNENLNELKGLMFQDEIDEIVTAVEGFKGENSSSRTIASNDIPLGFSSGFKDMAIKIMGVEGVIVDADTVNSALDKIHSWVRGFFYALLVIYNVNQIYRLIRGTTMFEGSGVKQTGGKANDN